VAIQQLHFDHITHTTMAAVQNPPGRTDWAEDEEADLATTIPPPQISKNKDGTETIVTVYINDDGKRVKRTQRIRRTVVKKVENPRVAERRLWEKIGMEAGKPAGPRPDTTTLGENIIFRPMVGYKSGAQQEKGAEDAKKEENAKKMQIKCRICGGDHFTTKCAFKDNMAPEGEAAGPPPDLDDRNGGEAEGGLGGGGSSYVPPHLRKGAAGAGGGERMGGGKYERDDLATLRVTNVSRKCIIGGELSVHVANMTFRSRSSQKKTSYGPCSTDMAVLLASSLQRIERQIAQRASRSFHMLTDRMRRGRARRWRALATII
jgi:translation initiation factor 3 subunit G